MDRERHQAALAHHTWSGRLPKAGSLSLSCDGEVMNPESALSKNSDPRSASSNLPSCAEPLMRIGGLEVASDPLVRLVSPIFSSMAPSSASRLMMFARRFADGSTWRYALRLGCSSALVVTWILWLFISAPDKQIVLRAKSRQRSRTEVAPVV